MMVGVRHVRNARRRELKRRTVALPEEWRLLTPGRGGCPGCPLAPFGGCGNPIDSVRTPDCPIRLKLIRVLQLRAAELGRRGA